MSSDGHRCDDPVEPGRCDHFRSPRQQWRQPWDGFTDCGLPLYSPRGAPTEQSWTRSPVPGNKLADKPVYVLTSTSTWSGAEQFSYDLKMPKRAILVGETTRGGAHAGVFHRIDDHFGMGLLEEKPINPFGKADWEGTGVDPDVKVKAADALDTALKLADSKLH